MNVGGSECDLFGFRYYADYYVETMKKITRCQVS
jgi:hypothetical protein